VKSDEATAYYTEPICLACGYPPAMTK